MQTEELIDKQYEQIEREKFIWEILDCEKITHHQAYILFQTARGYDDEYIANELHISALTVKKNRDNGFQRMGIHSRFQLMGWFVMKLFKPIDIIQPEAPSQPVKRYELLNIKP